jgi:uncharacterized protein (TIGR02246 family)
MSTYLRAATSAVLLLLTALVTLPAAAPIQQPSVTLPPELQRVLRSYERAWSQKDASALAGLFVEDGFVLSPGNPMVRGRATIEQFYRGSGGAPLALRAVAFASEGRLAYIIGAYAVHVGDPDRGKFTLTLRREASGSWMIVSDMDNGNEPRS